MPIILAKNLYQHQKKAVVKCLKKKRFGLFYDMGTGKTRIMLYVIKNLNKFKGIKALIICPLSIIETAWLEDAKVCGVKIHNLRKKFKLSDNYIVNYESFFKWHDKIKQLDPKIDCIILDESIKVKTPNAKITKAIYFWIRKHCPSFKYIMTGNPTPNSLLELFSQIRMIDESVFGTIFARYKDMYFRKVGYNYIISKRNKEIIYQKIAGITEFLKKEDCIDLPDRINIIRKIQLPNKVMRDYYIRMKKQMVVEIENELKMKQKISATNIAIKIMKLRQILSGFIYDKDKNALRIDNSKFKELKYLLEILKPEQVLVWCCFREDIDYIYEQLKDKESVTFIYGGLNDKTRNERIKGFQEGKYRILVAHPQSIGHGLTFVNCRYAIYYSLDYNLDTHQQSRDRIYRIGQKKKVVYYYLLVDKSIDFYIYNALKKKRVVLEDMIEYLRKEVKK